MARPPRLGLGAQVVDTLREQISSAADLLEAAGVDRACERTYRTHARALRAAASVLNAHRAGRVVRVELGLEVDLESLDERTPAQE